MGVIESIFHVDKKIIINDGEYKNTEVLNLSQDY